jgi:site-specific DNA recombinase
MKAVVYARISRDPTGTELGVQRQIADCETLAEQIGAEIVDRFVDDDRSAYSGKPRPEFDAMRELIHQGDIDLLLAWHPDRITRQPRELEDLIDLLEVTQTNVRTVQAGEYDLGTPSGRMTARVVGAVARAESEHKSVRLRRKHLELAEGGKLSGRGSTRPYGYADDFVTVVPHEAEVIRELAERVLAGEATTALVRELNERNEPTPSGKVWTSMRMRRIMTSGRIAGLRTHHGKVVAEAEWSPIITPAEHHRLVALFEKRRGGGGRPRKLLTGLLVCGQCGGRMMSQNRENARNNYRCQKIAPYSGCGGVSSLGDPLEALVVAAVLQRLDVGLVAEVAQPSVGDSRVEVELAEIADRLGELAAMWAAGELDRTSWQAARQSLETRQSDLGDQVRRESSRSVIGDPEAIVAGWDDLGHDRRRAVLAAVIDRIEVAPGRRGYNQFDPNRITIHWSA